MKLVLASLALIQLVQGHGYMEDPPARNSMWRYGFRNPKNYNDNENFCGGNIVCHTKFKKKVTF